MSQNPNPQGGSVAYMSKPQNNGPRVNHQIRVPQVRVVEDGKMVGVIPTNQALQMAKEKGVDLIEIDPNGSPPTCKLMEFGKYKYELQKREKNNKAKKVDTKELKIRPRTEDHDLNIKIKHAREFLEDGDKVRFTVMFQGREMAYKNQGADLLKKVVAALEDLGKVDSPVKMEGNNMSLLLSPK